MAQIASQRRSKQSSAIGINLTLRLPRVKKADNAISDTDLRRFTMFFSLEKAE